MSSILKRKNGRVLAFGAHPDDLEYGAGGFLSRLSYEGAKVTMVVTCVPSQLELRCKESIIGAEIIGADLEVLFDDMELRVEDMKHSELVAKYDKVIGKVKPDLVITHAEGDLHWDHTMVNHATLASLRRTTCDVLSYLSSPMMNAQTRSIGTCYIDITDYIDTKVKAVRSHKSQLDKLPRPEAKKFINSIKHLARGNGSKCGYDYAESFEVLALRR